MTQMTNNYLNSELSGLQEDIKSSQEKVRSRQNILAEEIRGSLGKDIKDHIKPKNKFIKFLRRLFAVYG